MQSIVVTAKRKGDWRGALIVDSVFQDALVSEDPVIMVEDAIVEFLEQDLPEGSTFSINLVIQPAGEKTSGS